MGLKIVSTTCNPDKIETLKEHGIDEVVIDDGSIAKKVREIFPNGVALLHKSIYCGFEL